MNLRVIVLADASVPHAIRWCNMLSELGVDVLLFSLEEPRDPIKFHVHLYEPPVYVPHRLRYAAAVAELNRVIKGFKPHLLNPHYIPNYGLMSYLANGLPFYMSVWGSDLLLVARNTRIKRLISRKILKNAAALHVDAHHMADILKNEFGIPADRIDVFPFGVESEFLNAKPKTGVRDAVMWTVVSHRRLDRDMDPMTILRAAHLLMDEPVQFILMSDGELMGEMKDYIARHNLNVELTGRLMREQMISTLLKGDLWVSASLTDSTPVSLLEAMSLGLLPIVTNLPALREWVIDGLNGLMFEPGDAQGLANAIKLAIRNIDAFERALKLNVQLIRQKADLRSNMLRIVAKWERLAFETQNRRHAMKL